MSKLVSLRLEDELAAWVETYREQRGWARAELIDAALRSYRQETQTGVPDLPVASIAVPVVKPSKLIRDAAMAEEAERKAREAMQAANMARQSKLNAAKYR